MDKYSFLNAAHTVYFAELYEKYKGSGKKMEPEIKLLIMLVIIIEFY